MNTSAKKLKSMLASVRPLIVFLVCTIGLPWSEGVAAVPGTETVQTVWMARYNGPGYGADWAYAIVADSAGNVFVTGSSWSSSSEDYATVKYDGATGNQLWVARYNGPGNGTDVAKAIVVDGAGNVYVAGYSRGSGAGSDYATIKYDGATGNQLWVARYNGPANSDDMALALRLDSAGNVFVTGASWDPGGQDDFATVKYDGATGSQMWVARYNGPANDRDRAFALAVDSGGNVVVTGWSRGVDSDMDYATVKYDGATGNQLWVARFNGPRNGEDKPEGIGIDSAGDVIVTGYSRAISNTDEYDFNTIKYHGATGNPLWLRTYNSEEVSYDRVSGLAVDASGDVIVTGDSYRITAVTSDGTFITNPNILTIKYKGSDGSEVWRHVWVGPDGAWDSPSAVTVDATGNVFVIGSSWNPDVESDYATIKLRGLSGTQSWQALYRGPGMSIDYPTAITTDASGCALVTGSSAGEYHTIKYCTGYKGPVVRFPNRRDFIPYCFDIPGRWPVRGGMPVPFAGPSCPPPWACPECSFAAGWNPGKTPPLLIAIYAEVMKSFGPTGEEAFTQKDTQQIAALLRKAPSGLHYTDAVKASVLAELTKLKGGRGLPQQAAAGLTKAISALELDWRVPRLSSAEVKPGKRSTVDFQGVAWVAMSDVGKPGKVALRLEPGLPAAAPGFTATWPVATYAFDFSGQSAKDGYMDVSFHTRGMRFEGAPSMLRILQWDGKTYKDITTHFDAERGIITGRTTRLSTFVLMTR